jgi:hypothetical protein
MGDTEAVELFTKLLEIPPPTEEEKSAFRNQPTNLAQVPVSLQEIIEDHRVAHQLETGSAAFNIATNLWRYKYARLRGHPHQVALIIPFSEL